MIHFEVDMLQAIFQFETDWNRVMTAWDIRLYVIS